MEAVTDAMIGIFAAIAAVNALAWMWWKAKDLT